MPETLRRIVGNGSYPAPWWDRPLIPLIGPFRRHHRHDPAPATLLVLAAPRLNPLLLLKEPDVVFVLLLNGFVYVVFVAMQATTFVLIQTAFPNLSLPEIGLCFAPFSVGCIVGTLVTGKLLDRQYQKDRAKWEQEQPILEKSDSKRTYSTEEELTFPIEKARLKSAMAYNLILTVMAIPYGWMLQRKVNLAGPLIFQFVGE